MLATTGELPVGEQWSYEMKWDGFRAVWAGGRYVGRSGRILDGPRLPPLDVVLDGELVAFDATGLPSFNALQQGGPVTYIAFDLLAQGGRELLDLPLTERRRLLSLLPVQFSPSFGDGPATVAAARDLGLEGVMAKRGDSRYRPGTRSPDWIKGKFTQSGDFVVGGWRPGARRLGALLVGVPGAGGLLDYRGRVGGGITAATEALLLPVLAGLSRPDSPFREPVELTEPGNRPHWVEPLLVVEVLYRELTPDGRLRFPSFLRPRPDKLPEDCL